jgi:hypothetical protein
MLRGGEEGEGRKGDKGNRGHKGSKGVELLSVVCGEVSGCRCKQREALLDFT